MKIISYNIFSGTQGTKTKELANLIKNENPDLVALQEVDFNCLRSKNCDMTKEIADICGFDHMFYKGINLPSSENKKDGEYGTAILSKTPILSSKLHKLVSDKYEQRILGEITVEINGEKISFFNAHLSFEEEGIRARQFEQLNEILSKKDKFVLCGDFNVYSLLEFENLKFSKINSITNPMRSFTGVGIFNYIDNIVYSSNFKCVSSGMVESDASDHNLIYANLI